LLILCLKQDPIQLYRTVNVIKLFIYNLYMVAHLKLLNYIAGEL